MTDTLSAENALPFPDIPRLRKAVEWVEAEAARPREEREWNQLDYVASGPLLDRSCNTCFCVAGKVCDDAGMVWDADENGYLYDRGSLNGEPVGAHDGAEALLGLSAFESNRLFRASNTAADVRLIAESIAARVGERL